MKKQPLLVITLTASLLTSTLGQTRPEPNSEQNSPSADEVVRIDTNLVQVDAIVTDSSGKQVTDLRPEDFEILEDDRPQQITAFTYVTTVGERAAPESRAALAASPSVENLPPAPPHSLKREQVNRTIVAAVDDLGLSFESMDHVRHTLKKFVDEQMQPGDLVAIVRTSGGASDLWQLTTDKQLLAAAIERLKWRGINNRVGLHALSAKSSNDMAFTQDTLGATLNSLQYITAGLKSLPGRKSLMLFTDDLPLLKNACRVSGDPEQDTTIDSLVSNLIQSSNQASVVINALDARGLATTSPTVADETPKLDATTVPLKIRKEGDTGGGGNQKQLASGEWMSDLLNERFEKLCVTQQSMKYLARKTGGLAIINNNDLNAGVGQIMNDLKGYYLIGYRPPEGTFEKKNGRARYHKINLRVKRPGLQVRSREGFFGEVEARPREAKPRTMEEQLVAAINSPFSASAVRLHLTALFGNAQSGSFIRVLIHVDARDLSFNLRPDGWQEVVLNVLASSSGEQGEIKDHIARTDTVRARGNTYARIQQNGLDYDLLVPVKKAGAYQLRAAVRDAATGRIGTANRLVEIPDLKNGQMTLSGISLSDSVAPTNFASVYWTTASQPVASLKVSQGVDGGEGVEAQPTNAVRRFARGMLLEYVYTIYNARADRPNSLPELTAEVRLFRDGQLVMSKAEEPLESSGLQFDPKRLRAKGALTLGDELQPGEYVLQVIVTDQTTKSKTEAATQWIDFEIVK